MMLKAVVLGVIGCVTFLVVWAIAGAIWEGISDVAQLAAIRAPRNCAAIERTLRKKSVCRESKSDGRNWSVLRTSPRRDGFLQSRGRVSV